MTRSQLRDTVMTVLGLALAVAPLALWVAWTETVYYAVLLVFALVLTLYALLCRV